MRTFAATVAIIACIGLFLPFEVVNGVVIIAPDGTYIPGSVLKWKSVYESLKKFADAEGKEYLQNVQDELAPIDVALQNNDMAGVAKSLHVAAPNIKKLSAHVKNNMLKNFAKMNSKLIETLVIPKLEQEGSTIEDFNVYLVETTRSVKGIFSKLLNMVFDLMGNVVDEISPDME